MFKPAQDESFWDFSLRVYRLDGVSEACLALQDEQGADVNMILYCCWAGTRAAALDDVAFERALEFSSEWATEVVSPLRRIRRWMKQEVCDSDKVDQQRCATLREQVKAVELAAEQFQQLTLAALPLPAGETEGLTATAANLRRYFSAMGIAVDDDIAEQLMVILRAAFPHQGEKRWRTCARSVVDA